MQQLDEFNDLYFSRLGPLMQQIALRKTLAELNLRRQQAETSSPGRGLPRARAYMAQAVEGSDNAHPALARSARGFRSGGRGAQASSAAK